jgi:WD40 repeat protein
MTSIFLSYARGDDEPFVWRLYERLTKSGLTVWFDRVSMPSRQLTFYQEIRDAIAARDRLVLVVGPRAIASDYVNQEWRFAYFEALKCVNPVVRLDGKDAGGKSIDGYALIPEDLRLIHAEDFRRDDEFEAHAENLVRQLSEALPPAGKLVAVPELPPHFVAQPDRIKALLEILLADLTKPVVVSGAAGRVGLQGMGGIGKSVLASALAHRPEVRWAFPDGVYWVTLGQEPHIEELQQSLLQALGEEGIFAGIEAGKQKLREALARRAALLVLDNVWQRPHAEAFNVIGPRCRLLLTTRDAGVVTALASRENHYQVQLPTAAEAEALLAKAAGADGTLPPETRAVIEQCRRLPLALALCGGMVRRHVPWSDVLAALRERDLKYISDRHPLEQQHANIWRAIDASVHVLGSEERDRFAELAVFALDTGAPDAAVLTLWEHTAGLSPRYARELLGNFAEWSLVERNEKDGRIKLHDLIHNFATGMAEKQFGAVAALHERLLDAYQKKCSNGWPSGPDDGYFLQSLCTHLVAAERTDDAVTLLTELSWIEVESRAKLIFSLQQNYKQVIAAMPEAQEPLRREREHQIRLECWATEIMQYSRQWSELHERQARREVIGEPEPDLPEVPVACRMWTADEIGAECRRIINSPTRLDRMQAFASFVVQECYPLLEFGARPGFVAQHAFNHAPRGAVHDAAARMLPGVQAPLLTRHWGTKDRYNPMPALLRVLEGHTGEVNDVSVTANGQRAVSGSNDNTLRVWDLETGACLRVVEGHAAAAMSGASSGMGVEEFLRFVEGQTQWIDSVSVTADGRRVVSGSSDNTLRVSDLETGACLQVLEGHTNWVKSVSVTPDGRRAVSGSKDNTLRVWDLKTGVCLRVLEGHTAVVNGVSVTPDGRRAVSGSWDKTVRVWDLGTGACLRVLEGHTSVVNAVSITPDGRRAVSGSWDETVRIWDLETGACLQVLKGHTSRIVSVNLTPDGRRAISGGWDRMLRVWDLETGLSLRALAGHTDCVMSVCVMADGRRAVSAGHDNTVRVWELETGAGQRVPRPQSNWFRDVTPDGRRAVSTNKGHALQVWDLETGARLQVMKGHRRKVSSLSVTPDGRRAVSASEDNTLRVWNLETGVCLQVLKGRREQFKEVRVNIAPDGQRAVISGVGPKLWMWDLEIGTCLRAMIGHTNVNSVSITPDGRHAVSAGGYLDRTLRVWELDTGSCLRVMRGHTDEVWDVSVTPDGRYVVSASKDSTLRVWDLKTGACLRVLDAHTKGVLSVKLTPDSRRAVSGSDDNTVRVWDLETGECAALVRLPTPGSTVSLAPALRRIIVGTQGQFDLRGLEWTDTKPLAPSQTEDPGVRLRREATACLQCWGETHLNTLLCKVTLAARLDPTGRATEAIKIRRDVGKICLSLDGEALAAAKGSCSEAADKYDLRESGPEALAAAWQVIERLIPCMGHTKENDLLFALRNKLKILKKKWKKKAEEERRKEESQSTRRQEALRQFEVGDFPGAEALLRGLLQEGYEAPGTHCHLARLLMMTDRDSEARQEIRQACYAWADGEEKPGYVLLRILFFQCLFSMLDGVDISNAFGRIKSALSVLAAHSGFWPQPWTIKPMLDHLRLRLGETNHAFLKALLEAVIHGRAIPLLDEFPQWRDAAAPSDGDDMLGRGPK